MLNTEPLQAAIQELARVVRLEGNAGRQVRRAVERLFRSQPDGRLVACFELASTAPDLVLAFQASQVERDLERLNPQPEENEPFGFELALLPMTLGRRCLVIEVRLSGMPDSLRDRQALLSDLGYALDRLEESMSGMQYDVEAVFDFLHCDCDPDEARRARDLARFEQLVRGDFSALGDSPMVIVSLAQRLNPAVRDAERRFLAEASV